MRLLKIIVILSSLCLCRAETLILSACEWAPFTGDSLSDKGLLCDLAVTALQRCNYQVEIEIIPWARAILNVKNGTSNGLIGASYFAERKQWSYYPDILYLSPIHLFTQAGRDDRFTSLTALAPASITLLNGSNWINEFEMIPGMDIQKVNDVELNFKKVAFNRADYSIETLPVILYNLNVKHSELKNRITILKPQIADEKIYLIFSKKKKISKQLTQDFNKALAEMHKDGTYQKIILKHLPELKN